MPFNLPSSHSIALHSHSSEIFIPEFFVDVVVIETRQHRPRESGGKFLLFAIFSFRNTFRNFPFEVFLYAFSC